MRRWTLTHGMAAAIACLGIVTPQAAFAGPPDAGRIADVALRDGGIMIGAVYSAEGLPQADQLVSVQTKGREVVRSTTDEHGRFIAEGLKGGVYQLVTAEGASTYRAWSAGTAPPAAQPAALVVNGEVVRGFGHHGGFGQWLSNPWVLAAIVATAIAVPIALSDDDDSDTTS